jgi:hypothetical protein
MLIAGARDQGGGMDIADPKRPEDVVELAAVKKAD